MLMYGRVPMLMNDMTYACCSVTQVSDYVPSLVDEVLAKYVTTKGACPNYVWKNERHCDFNTLTPPPPL